MKSTTPAVQFIFKTSLSRKSFLEDAPAIQQPLTRLFDH